MNKENNITIKELAEHFRQEQPHLMRYACYRLGDADDAKDALHMQRMKARSRKIFTKSESCFCESR